METNFDNEFLVKPEIKTEIHGLAVHEGGHWLVSELSGAKVDRVELSLTDNGKGTGTIIMKSLSGTTLEGRGVSIAAGFAAELITFGKESLRQKGFGCFKTDSIRLKQLGFSQDDTVRLIGKAQELITQNTDSSDY